jgi:DNA-directed RNA polymerase subunit RPC12/RpoP
MDELVTVDEESKNPWESISNQVVSYITPWELLVRQADLQTSTSDDNGQQFLAILSGMKMIIDQFEQLFMEQSLVTTGEPYLNELSVTLKAIADRVQDMVIKPEIIKEQEVIKEEPRDDHPEFKCQKCTRSFKLATSLPSHVNKCDGIPPPTAKPEYKIYKDPITGKRSYICSVADCSIDTKWTCLSSLTRHFNEDHADVTDFAYPCASCGRKFPNKRLSNQHRKMTHEEFFEYNCDLCGKKLPNKNRLKLHVMWHTGEKPFQCDKCDFRATTQASVKYHDQRVHQDVDHRPYVCEVCGKAFKMSSHLIDHRRVHSDETERFLCGLCGKALKNRQALNRHAMNVHDLKHSCDLCGKDFVNMTSLRSHSLKYHK